MMMLWDVDTFIKETSLGEIFEENVQQNLHQTKISLRLYPKYLPVILTY